MRSIKTQVHWLAAASLIALLPTGSNGEEPTRGASLGTYSYVKFCSACHGIDGGGKTPLAALFRIAPPDLTRIQERNGGQFPDALVQLTIDGRYASHGEREMPVWGHTLDREEIMSITEHLRSIQVRAAPKE